MQATEKLKAMQIWFDYQIGYFKDKFTSLSQLEKIYDFATSKGYDRLDHDYIKNNLNYMQEEEAYKFIYKVLKSK